MIIYNIDFLDAGRRWLRPSQESNNINGTGTNHRNNIRTNGQPQSTQHFEKVVSAHYEQTPVWSTCNLLFESAVATNRCSFNVYHTWNVAWRPAYFWKSHSDVPGVLLWSSYQSKPFSLFLITFKCCLHFCNLYIQTFFWLSCSN
jgi:hypothetical protein